MSRGPKPTVALPGDVFARLTVLEEVKPYRPANGKPARRVLCRCECGNTKAIGTNALKTGATRSCGCIEAERSAEAGGAAGDTFGSLTVEGEALPVRYDSGQLARRVVCRCECGSQTTVLLTHLRSGATKSCGCVGRHGHASHSGGRSPTYISWMGMRARCFNPNTRHFEHYGGRGITVCDRWRDSFENFLADMGERPEALTLDRIDNGGNYEPGNCRWATWSEQNLNRRPFGEAAA